MWKNLRQLIFLLFSLAILFILSGQSVNNNSTPDQSLPPDFSKHLDSLRNADDLTGWLYTYREYVYADPVNRIPLLTNAQTTAWRSCKNDTERMEWMNCLIAQGYYLLTNGKILRSINAYENAYQFYNEKPLADVDLIEFVLKPLGNNYTRLGDYDRALFIHEKSLQLALQKDTLKIASICHNMAITFIWKEDLALAKQYCERGLDHVKTNSPIHGLLLSTLAEVFLKSGNIAAAEINVKAAIKILSLYLGNKEEANVPNWLSGALQGKGDIENEKKQPALALLSYKKATAILYQYYNGVRKREKAKLFVSAGHVLLQLQQPKKAIESYDAALSLLIPSFKPLTIDTLPAPADLYGENTLSDALHGKADCLNALNRKEEALQCYMLLFITEGKLRHEFFSTAAMQQQQKESRNWVESAMATGYDLWKATGRAEFAEKILLIAEKSKAQLLLDEMMNNLRYNSIKNQDTLLTRQQQLITTINYYQKEAALETTTGKPDSNTLAAQKELQFELSLLQKQVKEKYPAQQIIIEDEEMPSANNLLQRIPENTTAIEFFTGTKSIYSIEAVKGKVQQIRKLGNAEKISSAVNDLVNTYFQHGPGNMVNKPQDYYRDAYTLYQLLWKDSITAVQQNCMIIPDGVFGYLPFDALVTDPLYTINPGQWPYLLQQTNLYYNYSLQTAQQQQQQKNHSTLFSGFFVSFDSSSRSSIPAVKKEYEEIQKVIGGTFFKENEASLSAFNKSLGEVNILHISTHSFLQGKENIPVLQLADARFFLFELYGKIFQPQLVVLSACHTGNGLLAEGEGIISLARGFIASGAAGIIAGLWNMNDETTAIMMGSFYRQLLTQHQPANALHAAKLLWLQTEGAEFQKLPYFWAGMIYSGANEPVLVHQKNTINKQWRTAIIILLSLLAIVLIYFVKKLSLSK